MADLMALITNWPSTDAPLSLTKVLYGVFFFAALYIGLNILSLVTLRLAKRIAEHTKTTLDDEVLIALQTPIQYALLLVSSYALLNYLYPALTILSYSLPIIFKLLAILLGAFTLNKIIKAAIVWYATDPTAKTSVKLKDEIIPIVSKSISVVVYVSAGIVILNQLGIEVAPLLAGLGIAGLAVALALQDSFTNFFAGLYILADRPVKNGDFIKIDDGTPAGLEGYVQEIGWRSIRLRLLSNDIVIIPNNKVATTVITNHYLPSHEVVTSLSVGVSYNADPEKVEKALLNAVESAKKKLPPGRILDAPAKARLWEFGEFSLTYKLFIPISDYTTQWETQAQIRKEILSEFKKGKIEIPFPIQTIQLKRSG
jgi:MscS family membrane protein